MQVLEDVRLHAIALQECRKGRKTNYMYHETEHMDVGSWRWDIYISIM